MSNLAGTFKSTLKTVQNQVVNDVLQFSSLITGAAQSSYVIQCDVACVGETGVQVSIRIRRPGTPETLVFLVRKAPVPQGSTLQVIDGQKLVLQTGDVLEVACETEGQSVDVVVSHVDHVNLD
jgi:hypothetical protein